jgi:tRNA(Ile)-lysidine synthase
MANTLEQHFLTKIRQLTNFQQSNFLIAYSAGIDSTAVLHIANKIFSKLNIQFSAVFFSHINSPINDGEEDNLSLAIKTCKTLNIEFNHQPLDLSHKGQYSWEQYGRMLRQQYYNQNNFDYVLLGHHKDDQDETTLIQMFRGAGKAVAGMHFQDHKLIRPFLEFPKKDLTNYLIERNLEWLDDPTNSNEDLTRNFWRNKGIPTIQEHYPNLSSTLQAIRDKFLEQDEIALELAKVDGLEEFISFNKINPTCNSTRLINLISVYLNCKSLSCQKKTLRTTIQNNWLKRDFNLETNSYVIYFSKNGTIDFEDRTVHNQLKQMKKHP